MIIFGSNSPNFISYYGYVSSSRAPCRLRSSANYHQSSWINNRVGGVLQEGRSFRRDDALWPINRSADRDWFRIRAVICCIQIHDEGIIRAGKIDRRGDIGCHAGRVEGLTASRDSGGNSGLNGRVDRRGKAVGVALGVDVPGVGECALAGFGAFLVASRG